MPQMRLVMKCESRGSFPRRKTLYPRKIEDVALHSTTRRVPKSILVWMPRLPMIRVTGSQDISTSWLWDVVLAIAMVRLLSMRVWVVPGGQDVPVVMPLRFLVHRAVGQGAEDPDEKPVGPVERRGEGGAGRLIHEGHEAIGKSRHGAGDADAAHVGAAADAVHPAALGDVAIHHRSPAADLHLALG